MFNLGKKIASSMAAFGLCGGLAFLAGCCDDCDDHHACDTCDQPACTACGSEVSVPVSSYSSTVSEEPINTSYVRESERAQAPAAVQPAPVSQGPSLREVEIRNKRERLLEIDREKVLYPDRISQLNDEAARIDRDLRAIEADMNAKGELSSPPANTSFESSNIQVQDRSNLGKPAEPLPTETAKPAPLPDNSAAQPAPLPDNSAAPAAPMPEPSAQPAPSPEPAVVAPPAPEQPAPQAAPLPDSTDKDADVRSDSKKMNDAELEALCQQIERDMDAQKKALESKPADAPSTENQAYPQGD